MNNPTTTIAQKFALDTTKPYFPVNTMRLLYLIIADGLTNSNPEATNQVNQVIPKISAVFDARDQFLSDNQDTNPLLEIQACRGAIDQIFQIINTPLIHHTFDLLFSDLYPLQENLLGALDHHLKEDTLTTADLYSILKIRSMDSVVYSTIINQIILGNSPGTSPDLLTAAHYQTTPIHWQINLTMQINDLVDAIIHAQEDTQSKSATIIDIIKKITTDPNEVEKTVDPILNHLDNQLGKLPFPQQIQNTVNSFNDSLIATIKQSPAPTPPESLPA